MARIITLTLFLALTLLTAVQSLADTSRWYTPAQVEQGALLFQDNCAGCHGDQAQGVTTDWRKPLPNGASPPPPLNGSAHAWHHSLTRLKAVIAEGSIQRGGKMPSFKSWMSDQEQDAVIAFFQSFWSERLYLAWLKRGGLSN